MSLDESYPRIQLTTARKAGDLLTVTTSRGFLQGDTAAGPLGRGRKRRLKVKNGHFPGMII
jgi:hypothetical protein